MAKILSEYNRLQAGDYENDDGGKRRVSRLTQFIHAIAKFTMRMCTATWPIDGEYQIVTYLESQTSSFLITIQIYRTAMAIKGRLPLALSHYHY